jgi:hypothetical protein
MFMVLGTSKAQDGLPRAHSPLELVQPIGEDLPILQLQLEPGAMASLRSRDAVTLTDFVLAPQSPGHGPSKVDLNLQRINVFGPRTRFVDGSRLNSVGGGPGEALPMPDVLLFSGNVANHADSRVFLSFSPHGVQGYVQFAGRTQVLSYGPHANGNAAVIYDADALPQGVIPWRDFVCRVQAPPGAATGNLTRGEKGPPPCRKILLAIETDYEFTAFFFAGDAEGAAAYVATLVGAVSGIYTNQLNVRLEVGFVRLWTTPADPWTAPDTVSQVEQFRDVWNASMGNTPRHVAHFLSGRALGGGFAYIGGICDPKSAYGLSANLNGFFPYPLQNFQPQNWDPTVVAHELGHSFGSLHTHDYCPPLDECPPPAYFGTCQTQQVCTPFGTIMSYCHLCVLGMTHIMLEFHPTIASDMLGFFEELPPEACSLDCPPGCSPQQMAKLIAADATAEDRMGESVAFSGDTVVVGATEVIVEGGAGSAYVYVRGIGGVWPQQVKLTASDGAEDDWFGNSVSIHGDTAIVGAHLHDLDEVPDAGSAYVFTRTGANWKEEAKLVAPDPGAVDMFGYSVAILGDTAIVGAPRHSLGGTADHGATYVFTRTEGVWTLQQKLFAPDPGTGDQFGYSVSIFGDTLIIGAFRDNHAGGTVAGSAYVFTRTGSVWTLQAKLVASDGTNLDQFGFSVAIHEDTAVVGAPFVNFPGITDAGAAYVFVRSDGVWTEQQKLIASNAAAGDFFGASVAASGETAVVGAWGTISGSAYIFTRSGGVWTQQDEWTASDAANGDQLGRSVAVFGDTAVAGAIFDDHLGGNSAGSAYVFRLGCDPTGSCCMADGSCSVTTQIDCAGIWSLDADCTPNPCLQPDGSCCAEDGSCTVTKLAECLGTWTMFDNCSPNPCPPPIGSCCAENGSCAETTQAECFGTWTMLGSCSPNPCPLPAGSCCVKDGSCTVTMQAECNGIWVMFGSCLPDPCKPIPCCTGDFDGDQDITYADISYFVDALLFWVKCPAPPDCCLADVSEDGENNGVDIQSFVEKLQSEDACQLGS